MQLYKKILRGEIEIPDYFSSDLTDLIRKLLELRSNNRYGCLETGTKDIKNHKWFSSIDWIAIGEKRLQAPFIPKDDEDYYEQYDEKPLTSAETDLYPTEFDSF
jgi:serine/threonine protein kinase